MPSCLTTTQTTHDTKKRHNAGSLFSFLDHLQKACERMSETPAGSALGGAVHCAALVAIMHGVIMVWLSLVPCRPVTISLCMCSCLSLSPCCALVCVRADIYVHAYLAVSLYLFRICHCLCPLFSHFHQLILAYSLSTVSLCFSETTLAQSCSLQPLARPKGVKFEKKDGEEVIQLPVRPPLVVMASAPLLTPIIL